MATWSVWLAICQATVPVVVRLGVSIPAVTTKFDMTKHDIRKGRKTGSPVSGPRSQHLNLEEVKEKLIPGWSVESTTFLAVHSSGVICWSLPCLYCVTRDLAFSRPVDEVKSVLQRLSVGFFRLCVIYCCKSDRYKSALLTHWDHMKPGLLCTYLTSDRKCLRSA